MVSDVRVCHLAPGRRGNESGVCLDLQVIDMVPSGKVQEETETHHLLTGNLYKPRRRVSPKSSRMGSVTQSLSLCPASIVCVSHRISQSCSIHLSRSIVQSVCPTPSPLPKTSHNVSVLPNFPFTPLPLHLSAIYRNPSPRRVTSCLAVPGALQPPLRDGGGQGEAGQGGVPAEHAQPPRVLQVHPPQGQGPPQEGAQPEKGRAVIGSSLSYCFTAGVIMVPVP